MKFVKDFCWHLANMEHTVNLSSFKTNASPQKSSSNKIQNAIGGQWIRSCAVYSENLLVYFADRADNNWISSI